MKKWGKKKKRWGDNEVTKRIRKQRRERERLRQIIILTFHSLDWLSDGWRKKGSVDWLRWSAKWEGKLMLKNLPWRLIESVCAGKDTHTHSQTRLDQTTRPDEKDLFLLLLPKRLWLVAEARGQANKGNRQNGTIMLPPTIFAQWWCFDQIANIFAADILASTDDDDGRKWRSKSTHFALHFQTTVTTKFWAFDLLKINYSYFCLFESKCLFFFLGKRSKLCVRHFLCFLCTGKFFSRSAMQMRWLIFQLPIFLLYFTLPFLFFYHQSFCV